MSLHKSKNLDTHVIVSNDCHDRLEEACMARFGTTSIRWSDALEQILEDEIARQRRGGE